MDLKLHGRVVLITGASRGLGYAAARVIGQEGAKLAINSRNVGSLEEAAQVLREETRTEVLALPGDLVDPDVPRQLVEQTASHYGRLDILIANAGGPPAGRFETLEEKDWMEAINLSFMSNVRLIKAALPYLRNSDAASVLTVTSWVVKQPLPNLILSNSIRSATIGLTKTLALELGKEGIRFNSILPAWTDTERFRQLMGLRAKTRGASEDDEMARAVQETALGRIGTPDEFANAAAFMVSPVASFITGHMLAVDGGVYKGTY